MVDLVLVDHLGLLHTLHCYDLTTLNVPANTHFSEGAAPNDGLGLEVASADLLSHLAIELSFLVEDVLLDEFLLGA